MPRIFNTSKRNVELGFHPAFPPDSILVQIVSTGEDFPAPKAEFAEIHQYRFLDVDDEDEVLDPSMRISRTQAKTLVSLLLRAYDSGKDVLVHCEAGVSRSRAVAEIGQMIGFEYLGPDQGCANASIRRLLWSVLYEVSPPTFLPTNSPEE